MSDDDEAPDDTPRVCEACGGTGGISSEPCRWCSRGFQDHRQQVAWARFRVRARSLSGTYSVLEETVHEVLRCLGERRGIIAAGLSNEGSRLLEAWFDEEIDETKRRELNSSISDWIKRSIAYLSAK